MWQLCTKGDGKEVVVNLGLATTMVRLKDRTRIEFDGGNTVEVVEDLEMLLAVVRGTADADRA